MFSLKILNKISPSGLCLLNSDYTYGEDISDPDGILVRSASMHEMTFPESLKAIARAGAGTNNIPIDLCSEKGIVVFNTPGANANAVKELVITALLLSSRKVIEGIEWTKSLISEGANIPELVEKGKAQFAGPELEGKTLGIIGLGAIGVLVANAAVHLGMNVLGYDPYISVDAAWNLSRSVKKAKSYKEVYENSDYITLHVPLNAETKCLICSDTISHMKKGVRIINFSRGAICNNADMAEALENGTVKVYVTDFPDEEVLKMKNTICIPHLAASTPESEDNCAYMAVSQIKDYLQNGNIKNSVNFPNVEMPRDGVRICIIHKNLPNTLGQLSKVFGDQKINIENMVNKSKKDYAYTMIDIKEECSDELIEKLKSVDNVIRLRVLN